MNSIEQLHKLGQSIWFDNIERRLLTSGVLAEMIQRGEIRGVTSNPSIFNKAISGSKDYDQDLIPLAKQGKNKEEIYESLAVADIQAACDLFMPLYQETGGGDGYVSLEVSPYLARDTQGTLTDALRLWNWVAKPNLMVKIPATREGLPAISQGIENGVNINVTLIFSLDRYHEVMDAYLIGLERRLERGEPIDNIASVASFFVSRIDTNVDDRLWELVDRGKVLMVRAREMQGTLAIASARLAYKMHKAVFSSERFARLSSQGARAQRPLWASTSTKNPDYLDTMYVDELIGPGTVNTVPPKTLEAFKDHGKVALTLDSNLDKAQNALDDLASIGISLDEVTQELEVQGVKSFADAFTELLESVDQRRLAAI
jgi:transaldolase